MDEANFSSPLEFKHISTGVTKTLEYIDKRRKGEEKSLKTSFSKLNKVLLGGIDWFRIFTIAGSSGAGKSTILENLKRDFLTLNDPDFDILSFEFEMRIEDQLSRSAAADTQLNIKEIYSATDALSDKEFERIKESLDDLKDKPLYYVDNVGSVSDIINTIIRFVDSHELEKKNRGIIVTIDHIILTKGRQGESEKDIIDNLMKSLVALKKLYASRGIRCLFITLSQLNRDIESVERIQNKNLNYPNKNDLFAASSVYYCSDYVLISHRPSTITGLGQWYGPQKNGFPYGYPVVSPRDPKKSMVYWHLVKERFGEGQIIAMVENFQFSKIEEYIL